MSSQVAYMVLLDYLLAEPTRISRLLMGLEPHEYHVNKVVRVAVTCNLYKIIYDASSIYSTYPEELGIAVCKLSYSQIEAFVTTLCSTYIKKIIKENNYTEEY